MSAVDISDLGRVIAELLGYATKRHRSRRLRTATSSGNVYSRYSGAHLRRIRAEHGVGRPPSLRRS